MPRFSQPNSHDETSRVAKTYKTRTDNTPRLPLWIGVEIEPRLLSVPPLENTKQYIAPGVLIGADRDPSNLSFVTFYNYLVLR